MNELSAQNDDLQSPVIRNRIGELDRHTDDDKDVVLHSLGGVAFVKAVRPGYSEPLYTKPVPIEEGQREFQRIVQGMDDNQRITRNAA